MNLRNESQRNQALTFAKERIYFLIKYNTQSCKNEKGTVLVT